MGRPKVNLIGKRFGLLTVLKEDGKHSNGQRYFICKCDCGNTTRVLHGNLGNGTSSCGCFRITNQSKKAKLHGESNSRIYKEYYRMMTRCYNPNTKNFKNWGGKGVIVCEDWKNDKLKFIEWSENNGYSENLTLDRIDVNGNYEPSNCRWVTMKQQMSNKTNNVYILVDGERHQLSTYCDDNNLKYSSIHGKVIRRNQTIEINGKKITKDVFKC